MQQPWGFCGGFFCDLFYSSGLKRSVQRHKDAIAALNKPFVSAQRLIQAASRVQAEQGFADIREPYTEQDEARGACIASIPP